MLRGRRNTWADTAAAKVPSPRPRILAGIRPYLQPSGISTQLRPRGYAGGLLECHWI
jgi:hypothetical protein